MQKSDFTPEEELMIQREFEALLDDYAHTPHRHKVELITHAFNFARYFGMLCKKMCSHRKKSK